MLTIKPLAEHNWDFFNLYNSDVNYDRELVLAFFCEYYKAHKRQRCSYVELVPVERNVRMFLEYLNNVKHFLLKKEKAHKAHLQKKRYYVGKIPTWEDPPPFPQYGNFFDKIPFFSEDVPK